MAKARFTLLMATIGRTDELVCFFDSLSRQGCDNCQMIIVDQNTDDRIQDYLPAEQDRMELIRLRSTPGLSHARNIGLDYANGEIVAFPDDDCWYADGLLQSVDTWFQNHPLYSFLIVASRDGRGNQTPASARMCAGEVNYANCLRVSVSYTIFALRSRHNHNFDERLGVGAGTVLGSGEDMDYVLQMLKDGGRGWYEPSLTVFHPYRSLLGGKVRISKAFGYGVGIGYVVGKNKLPSSIKTRWILANPIGGMVLALATARFRGALLYVFSGIGRLWGYALAARGA